MEIISLGTDCLFKTFMTELGYKKKRIDGEKTNPFDLAIHSYKSVLHFMMHGFDEYIKDDDIYINDEGLLCNKRWNTVFVHESNSFKDIAYIGDCWKKQSLEYNFIDNNYKELKRRYNRRIKDLEYILKDKEKEYIFCYHTRCNEHCAELYQWIKENYVNSWLIVINTNNTSIYDDNIDGMYIYKNSNIKDDELWNSSETNANKVKVCIKECMNYIENCKNLSNSDFSNEPGRSQGL